MLPGVRPSISFAALPTARTLSMPRPSRDTATTEGSETTMPWPFAYTTVLAVPRSMARSLENQPRIGSRITAPPPDRCADAPLQAAFRVARSPRGHRAETVLTTRFDEPFGRSNSTAPDANNQ